MISIGLRKFYDRFEFLAGVFMYLSNVNVLDILVTETRRLKFK